MIGQYISKVSRLASAPVAIADAVYWGREPQTRNISNSVVTFRGDPHPCPCLGVGGNSEVVESDLQDHVRTLRPAHVDVVESSFDPSEGLTRSARSKKDSSANVF
jgi:hypothetical protein